MKRRRFTLAQCQFAKGRSRDMMIMELGEYSFSDNRIPQLAVSAKLLCLLMVVICGAQQSMVRSVRLHNDCSGSELQVNMTGKVYARDPQHNFNDLTLKSVAFNRLTIFAEKSKRYLCFTKGWKLIGMRKNRGKRCQFEETMEHGFNRYRSVANTNYSIGFNRKGFPIRGPLTANTSIRGRRNLECTKFIKTGVNLSHIIDNHNKGDKPGPVRYVKQSAFPSILQHASQIKTKKRKKSETADSERTISSDSLPKHRQRHSKNNLTFS